MYTHLGEDSDVAAGTREEYEQDKDGNSNPSVAKKSSDGNWAIAQETFS